MRVVSQICDEGCMTITEGAWYWLLVLWIADHLKFLPLRAWVWVYDHVEDSVWRPGHIGQEGNRKLLLALGLNAEADALQDEPPTAARSS